MIRQEQAKKTFTAGKRLRLDDVGGDASPAKQLCVSANSLGNVFARRLQGIVADQQEANNNVSAPTSTIILE